MFNFDHTYMYVDNMAEGPGPAAESDSIALLSKECTLQSNEETLIAITENLIMH